MSINGDARTEAPRPCWEPAAPAAGRLVRRGGTTVFGVTKVTIDLALALVLLALSAPVILLAALAVRLTSRGPAFYCQTRLGRGGRTYTIFKLRTMYHNCEGRSGACWSTSGDPRVTPVGRFLRRTHIDELPQLWNVLRGEMSLVGPRPERPEFVPKLAQAIPGYRDRLLVKPGITGLAQVQLPPDSDLDSVRRKLTYDLLYTRRCGLWLDLRLIGCTALQLFGMPVRVAARLFVLPRPRAGGPPSGAELTAAQPVAELGSAS